ncbi:High-affinity nickel transport protein [Durusdinium trenchii]
MTELAGLGMTGDPERSRSSRSSLIIAVVILLTTLSLFGALLFVPELLASGLLAYSFGLRHAVDVDHIAAIDNITRKLTTRTSRPQTVGMFFALGHSSVVFLACSAIVLAQHYISDHLEIFHRYGNIIGISVSGFFLFFIGLLNLYTARQLWLNWENGHNHPMMGCCLRCCPRLFGAISKPWHMLLVGFLFGLGFDTSTEVGLLGIVAVSHLKAPAVTILLLPLLFMSGMCLLDTLNGFFMSWVYQTSLEDDMQKTYFNFFLTSTSGVIALSVGSLELLGLPAALGMPGLGDHGFWQGVETLNNHFEMLGIAAVSFFAFSMLVAWCCYRRVTGCRSTEHDRVRRGLVRYVENGNLIDRSGV